MRVKPLKGYRRPTYPTIEAAGSARELLSRIPRRWQNSPRFCALLGLGLMVKTLTAGGDAPPSTGSAAPTTQAPSDSGSIPGREEVVRRVQEATSLVVPVLAEALQHDGRGSVGCIAVNPPTFLSEAEALELIRNELNAAGLKLEQGVELDRVLAPTIGRPRTLTSTRSSRSTGLDAVVMPAAAGTETAASLARPAGKIVLHNWPGSESPLVARTFVFDFADRDRSVYVEYFSPRDYTMWRGRSASTVQTYDFPALTRNVSESLARRESDKRVVFGLFFDPLARAQVPYPDTTGLDQTQKRMVRKEYERTRKTASERIGVRSCEKLRRQVRHFVAFLQQEGVIPAPQPESPDAWDQARGPQAHASDAPSDKSL